VYTAYLAWAIPEYQVFDLAKEAPEGTSDDELLIPEVNEDTTDDICIMWRTCETSTIQTSQWRGTTTHKLAKYPPLPATTVAKLQADYGAIDFIPALWAFMKAYLPSLSARLSEVDVLLCTSMSDWPIIPCKDWVTLM
jgi:hypothetical protein